MVHFGIDPGVSGGIVALSSAGEVLVAIKMPATERDLFEALGHLMPLGAVPDLMRGHAHAALERVSASPQMGVVSAFTFGRGFGALRMALTANRIPFDEVTPQKWQTAMGCLTRGDKNISKRRAQALFPGHVVTHAIADALLLAEYCRRVYGGSGAEAQAASAVEGESSKLRPATVSTQSSQRPRKVSRASRQTENRREGGAQTHR